MDSYTLFGHIVGIVGVNQCMQAHIELSGLGVLPEMTLEKTNALNQNDADMRAAFAMYCGLSNNPHKRWNSKQFFAVIQDGKGSVPLNIEGRNFIESLADILRNGPEAMGVESVFISYVISASDSHSGKAHIHFENGKTESFATGQVFPMTHTEGVLLSYSQLRALHEDLIATKRTWPQDEQLPLTHLQFDAGKIHII